MNERDPELVQAEVHTLVLIARTQATMRAVMDPLGVHVDAGVHNVPRDVFDALPGGEVVSFPAPNEGGSAFWSRRVSDVPFYTTEPPADWEG